MRRLHFRIAAILAPLLAVSLSCDSGSNGSGDLEEGMLIPLAVGNSWTFRAADAGFSSTERFDVLEKQTLNDGTERFQVRETSVDSFIVFGSLYTLYDTLIVWAEMRPTTLWLSEQQPQGSNRWGFMLRFPLKDGESYIHLDERGDEYEVVVVSERVAIGDDFIETLRYHFNSVDGEHFPILEDVYFAPGIGPVLIREERLSYTLIDYQIRK